MQIQTLQVTAGCLLQAADILAERAGGQAKKTPPRERSPEAERIIRLADRLTADGAASANGKPDLRRLAPVFTHLNGEHPGRTVEPLPLDGDRLPLPVSAGGEITPAQYRALLSGLERDLGDLPPAEDRINVLLSITERWTGAVPGVLPQDGAPDISLYDQVKIKAAVGAAVSEYLLQGGIGGRDLPGREAELRREPMFLLYSADFSGIQKFIYTVSTEKALRSLRSRSFFLELLMNHYIDELLEACGVSRASLLYSGGGHCYILLPNTEAVSAALQRISLRFNDWLMEQFGTRLFLAHGWTACSANDLFNIPAEESPYKAMFRRVSDAVARHKLHRCSAAQLRRLNRSSAADAGRECRVCGRSDQLNRDNLCPWCRLFAELSPKIQTMDVCIVTPQRPAAYDFALPAAEGTAYFILTDEADARSRLSAGLPVSRIYTKNRTISDLSRSIRFLAGDACFSNDTEVLSQSSSGVQRLAVCRMDVDNLGQAFVAGFETDSADPVKRYRHVTLTRTSAFSRQLSLFFQCWINPLLEQERSDGGALAVTVVYSGGDDVFLVGAWNDVIEAAERIQAKLTAFSCGALTISGGIALFDDHFPIRLAADRTAELEDRAKQVPGKNALALFDPEQNHTYAWSTFRDAVMDEKHRTLQRFFTMPGQERGNAFLYRLLQLLREAEDEKINLARYAYLLSRLEPKKKGPAREEYQVFAKNMYRWAVNPEDRGQLITAIHIYVYQNRESR